MYTAQRVLQRLENHQLKTYKLVHSLLNISFQGKTAIQTLTNAIVSHCVKMVAFALMSLGRSYVCVTTDTLACFATTL